ncbi:MAG: DUF115 domain-containing protein [Treponema sp.]|jgi:hypothetical protein|nr:DUF115 domain-containing protein [Treponema sp.]
MNDETPRPLLKAARRGFSISYRGKTLLSAFDPVNQAERAAAAAAQKRTLYFCPSPLLGYGLRAALEKLPPDSALLCVETDAVLAELSRASLDGGLLAHPALLFVGADTGPVNQAGLCAAVHAKWGERNFRRVETLKLSGGWVLNPEGYGELAAALNNEIALQWSNAMTLVKLGRRFMRNTIRSLPLLAASYHPAGLAFGAAPVLVLGAGPSLDPFLDALRAAPRFPLDPAARAFRIVCVDTCIPALRERELRPDLAVILESQFWNRRDFTGSAASGIAAAVDLSAYPGSAAALGGPFYFFFTPWTRLRLFARMKEAGIVPALPSGGPMPPLGSVGLSAVELARRLTAGPVVCAGIDFSFTLDASHARSSPAHLALLAAHNRLRSLLDAEGAFRAGVFAAASKSGGAVRSNPSMRNYRNLFEQEFSSDRRIFDVAGSGLPLGINGRTLGAARAIELLRAGGQSVPPRADGALRGETALSARLRGFIGAEQARLEELRGILSGEGGEKNLDALLDESDYLWAHFPECAGAGGRRPPSTELSFLKRVRTEIDPFISLWHWAAREMDG